MFLYLEIHNRTDYLKYLTSAKSKEILLINISG